MNIIGYKVMAVYPTGSQADAEQKFHEVTQALSGKGCSVYILAENADGTESIVGTFILRPETRQEKLARLLRENKERREAEATRSPPKLSRKAKKRLKRKAPA